MSDGSTDKYVHQSPVDPEPDGNHDLFAVPDPRLVPGSVKITLDGEDITDEIPEYDEEDEDQTQYIMLDSGRIRLEPPDNGQELRVSYYFQWFTDEELESFLTTAGQLLGYESVEAEGLTVGLRAPVLSFAAHYAYLKMAAQSAQALEAGAAGYQADNTQEHPNWMALAKLAWDTAVEELEVVNTSPVSATRPQMKFVNFGMARYVPRS